MSTPRFFVKMIDPDDFTKEKVVWANEGVIIVL